jgi:putative flippase GtrA
MVTMMTFGKAQIASLLATGVDFGVTFLLLRWLGVPPEAASLRVTFYGATGTICGGVTHFMLSRNWVFNAQEKKWVAQLNRYLLVWVGNLALNVSGFYLLTRYTELSHMTAKVVTAILIAVFYNYVLQKRYVFK